MMTFLAMALVAWSFAATVVGSVVMTGWILDNTLGRYMDRNDAETRAKRLTEWRRD
jgi:hypothetical protein